MEFFSGLALILLTLVGYSSGIAIGQGDHDMKPRFSRPRFGGRSMDTRLPIS